MSEAAVFNMSLLVKQSLWAVCMAFHRLWWSPSPLASLAASLSSLVMFVISLEFPIASSTRDSLLPGFGKCERWTVHDKVLVQNVCFSFYCNSLFFSFKCCPLQFLSLSSFVGTLLLCLSSSFLLFSGIPWVLFFCILPVHLTVEQHYLRD